MINMIVATDKLGLIGNDNELPWKLKNDMKHFKETTTGKNIVMGRKTFDSVGVLPNRKTFVLSRDESFSPGNDEVKVIDNIEYFLKSEEEYWIIGGAEIYKQFLPFTENLHLTIIYEEFKGDAYFPTFDVDDWKERYGRYFTIEEGHEYDHMIIHWERRKI